MSNFSLAPLRFGGEPQLDEGNLRFALNRVPDCVDPAKLAIAEESPLGRGRLVGKSFDFPRYSGPNGVLAVRVGANGSYSPATRPEIYYHELPAGFYRLVVTLARNNGAPTPYHAVTNFQILLPPGTCKNPARPGRSPAPRPPHSTEESISERHDLILRERRRYGAPPPDAKRRRSANTLLCKVGLGCRPTAV